MSLPRPLVRAATGLAAALEREPSLILGVAAAIGVSAGLAVVVFYRAIDLVQRLVLRSAGRTPIPAWLFIPAAVAAGLVACRALIRWGAQRSDGENISEVMRAVAGGGERLSARRVAVKTLAAAVVIGTGGSVGAEGPVVVAGAVAGSSVARAVRATPDRSKTLIGAGAAAGLAAAFNAPIAGVLFASEKILGTFGAATFAPVVVAAVLAAVVGRAILGGEPVIRLPESYALTGAWTILAYAGLGVVTGVVSVFYSRGIYLAQDWMGRLRRPWMTVALGVLCVGALDVAFRAELWGHGHQSLDVAHVVQYAAWFLIALAFAKLVATVVTFGAGGFGGVFTPALFIGATLGGGIGAALAALFPAQGLAPQAFAIVGMAGFVAGATHAPLTAMMMVFEMTGDYGLILPLMLCAAVAFLVARRIYPESVYTEWLVRRGIHLTHGADASLLARLSVAECYERRAAVLREGDALPDMLTLMRERAQASYPVVDGRGALAGLVTADELRQAFAAEADLRALVVAGDLAAPATQVLTPHDSLLEALRRFGATDAALLPVVRAPGDPVLLGVVHRRDLFAAYERSLHEAEV